MRNGHRQAADLRDSAGHDRRVAEQQGKQNHLTGHKQLLRACGGGAHHHAPVMNSGKNDPVRNDQSEKTGSKRWKTCDPEPSLVDPDPETKVAKTLEIALGSHIS